MRSLNRPLCVFGIFATSFGGGEGGGFFLSRARARIPEVEGGNVSWKLLLGDDS